jgi:tetratricopeptide (TPR) repeat protein
MFWSEIKLINCLIVSLFLVQTVFSQTQTPASARGLVKKGTLLMSGNHVDAAIDSYNQAIKLDPNYAEAYVNRGLARRAKGDLAGSIEDYEKAASINPKSIEGNRFVAQAYSNRGYIKLNALDVDNAIKDFTMAIKIDPDEENHYYKRGLARLVNEDLVQALEDLNKSLSLTNPKYSRPVLAYATRGMVKLMQGNEVDAQKDFDQSIKLNDSQGFNLDLYLRSLEIQIMQMRQLRAKQRKSIA